MASLELPDGRQGRILAVLITLLALALLWRALVVPLSGWYAARSEALDQKRALAARMELLAQRLPALRGETRALRASGRAGVVALIAGNSDAVASAAIQEKVSAMATPLGLSLSSTETLPGTRDGAYRRVGVRIALDAAFPVVVHLLEAIESAQPSLLVDNLQIHGTRLLGQSDTAPLNVSLSVLGYRAAGAAAPAGQDE